MESVDQDEVRVLHLLYHELSPVPQKYAYTTHVEAFESQLDLFRKMQDQKLRPAITFDDGHGSNYEYAMPLLETHGFKAHFFITVNWIGKRSGYMGWDQLRALHKAGHFIGGHGWDHALLTECNNAELQRELGDARKFLEDKLGAPVTTMSYPGGRFNKRVIEACTEAGYAKLYTSVPRAEPVSAGPLIGRLNIRGGMTEEWLLKVFTDGGATLRSLERQDNVKTGMKKVLGPRIYAALWALINRADPEAL